MIMKSVSLSFSTSKHLGMSPSLSEPKLKGELDRQRLRRCPVERRAWNEPRRLA
jgi:hypothetical protein